MRTGTIFKSYELFVASAVLASHANVKGEGFRQKDVRFLIELFSNWVETTFEGQVLSINNTQVLRYLDSLVEEGFARRLAKDQHPCYRLSRTGLIELISRLIPQRLYIQPEHFFFLFYFLKNYRPRIEKLVEQEGKQFPHSLRLEVESLLDVGKLVEQQIQYAKLEITKLKQRTLDAEHVSQLAFSLFDASKPVDEVAAAVEQEYPYELNSQKPLSELFSEIPEDLGCWELTEGSARRAKHLWGPSLKMLECYLECLTDLEKDC
jgi:hypothetical protein